jgi:hypothetical protein
MHLWREVSVFEGSSFVGEGPQPTQQLEFLRNRPFVSIMKNIFPPKHLFDSAWLPVLPSAKNQTVAVTS